MWEENVKVLKYLGEGEQRLDEKIEKQGREIPVVRLNVRSYLIPPFNNFLISK